MSDRRRALLRWLPALGWMAVIFALSSISGLRVSDDAAVDKPFRVVAHLGSYALLAGLLLYAIAGRRRPHAWEAAAAFGLAVLYGLTDEIHQSFVPNRMGQVDDLVIDAIGAVIGITIAWLVLSRIRTWTAMSDPSA